MQTAKESRKLTINAQSPSKRCEICHQSDCYDPMTEICDRCCKITSEPAGSSSDAELDFSIELYQLATGARELKNTTFSAFAEDVVANLFLSRCRKYYQLNRIALQDFSEEQLMSQHELIIEREQQAIAEQNREVEIHNRRVDRIQNWYIFFGSVCFVSAIGMYGFSTMPPIDPGLGLYLATAIFIVDALCWLAVCGLVGAPSRRQLKSTEYVAAFKNLQAKYGPDVKPWLRILDPDFKETTR